MLCDDLEGWGEGMGRGRGGRCCGVQERADIDRYRYTHARS